MKKITILIIYIIYCTIIGYAQESISDGKSCGFTHGRLIVSSNGRYLVHEDSTLFYYFADTAWELFHRLSAEEVDYYLEDRLRKGFTVIQAVILAELDGLNTANRNGDCPLINNNPAEPNEKYFNWVDEVIRKAQSKGLYIALLPTWGDKVDKKWGIGPVIFDIETAAIYGRFLGKRYKDYPNIIWINGGDRQGGGDNFVIWDTLGKAIKEEDKNHLMTYHPQGEASSSQWFHNSHWLDFNICQTGHAQTTYKIYKRLIVTDYNKEPVKPCMDAEPRYEDIPKFFNPEKGWFDESDVRKSMYWSLFSGSFGYTYGSNSVWQFFSKDKEPMCNARREWKEALGLPGASQIIHARNLLSAYDFLSSVPDQSIILSVQTDNSDIAVATRSRDYAFVYLPNGNKIEISLEKIPDAISLRLRWFNPRTGKITQVGEVYAKGSYIAQPVTSGIGNDWVLILEKI